VARKLSELQRYKYYVGNTTWESRGHTMLGLWRESCTKMRQKKCIIMHVMSSILGKVHYNAVFAVNGKKLKNGAILIWMGRCWTFIAYW
jgi:hypothetical protein